MAEIVVLGAGLIGLTTGLLLVRDGHSVTIVEKDPAPPPAPESAWGGWERPGVSQFQLLHIMLPRWHAEMWRELPNVVDELRAAGGLDLNVCTALPDSLTGGEHLDDERFSTVTARRPVVEAVLSRVAQSAEGISIVRGSAALGLISGPVSPGGPPSVAGVITRTGSLRADLVVDAMGRRSPMPTLVEALGARRPAHTRDESGFVYYMRNFRSLDGEIPSPVTTLLAHCDGVSLLTLPCDNGTWGVGFVTSSHDKPAKALHDPQVWQRALDLYPGQAPWANGIPVGDVQAFAGLEDRTRRYVVDGTPVVTGVAAVGDAWASTNPSLGRGATLGLLQAISLRDVLRSGLPVNSVGLMVAFADATERSIAPLFDATVAHTRHRLAEIDADIAGVPYQTADPGWAMSTALYAAAHRDPEVLRAYLDIVSVLATPEEVFTRPGLAPRVMQLAAGIPRYFLPGPSRAEFLATLNG